MKITIEGAPEEVKEMLQAIGSSKEQNENTKKLLITFDGKPISTITFHQNKEIISKKGS